MLDDGLRNLSLLPQVCSKREKRLADPTLEKYVLTVVLDTVNAFFSSPFSENSTSLQVSFPVPDSFARGVGKTRMHVRVCCLCMKTLGRLYERTSELCTVSVIRRRWEPHCTVEQESLSLPGVMGPGWRGCGYTDSPESRWASSPCGQQSQSRNGESDVQRGSVSVAVSLGPTQEGWPVSGALTALTEGVTASQPMFRLHSPKTPE